MISCSSYSELTVNDKITLPEETRNFRFTDTAGDVLKGAEVELKSAAKPGKQKKLSMTTKKYLARGKCFTPEYGIMDRGIEEALKGNYHEAETLFSAIRGNITDGSVENNLAVVYEMTERKKEAMRMYTTALIKSPENPEFRSNLYSFINHNKYVIKRVNK